MVEDDQDNNDELLEKDGGVAGDNIQRGDAAAIFSSVRSSTVAFDPKRA